MREYDDWFSSYYLRIPSICLIPASDAARAASLAWYGGDSLMQTLHEMNPPPAASVPAESAAASALGAVAASAAPSAVAASAGKAEAASASSVAAAAVDEPCAIVITSVYANGAIEGRVLRGSVAVGTRLRTVLDTESGFAAAANAGLRGHAGASRASAGASAAASAAGGAEAADDDDGGLVVHELALTGRRAASAAAGAFVGLRLRSPAGGAAAARVALQAGAMLVEASAVNAHVGIASASASVDASVSASASAASNASVFRLRSGAAELQSAASKNPKQAPPAFAEHAVAMVDTFEARITLMGVAPPAHGIPDRDDGDGAQEQQAQQPGSVKIGWSPILCALGVRAAVQMTHIIHELDPRTGAVVSAPASSSPIQVPWYNRSR